MPNASAFISFKNTRLTQHNFFSSFTQFFFLILSLLFHVPGFCLHKIFLYRVFRARNIYVLASVSVSHYQNQRQLLGLRMLIDNFEKEESARNECVRKRAEKEEEGARQPNCISFEINHQSFLHHLEINSSLFSQQSHCCKSYKKVTKQWNVVPSVFDSLTCVRSFCLK